MLDYRRTTQKYPCSGTRLESSPLASGGHPAYSRQHRCPDMDPLFERALAYVVYRNTQHYNPHPLAMYLKPIAY
jgi:hypothetical protein